MRKILYLLSISLILAPLLVSAALNNPPSDFKAVPDNQGNVQVQWQNKEGYDLQVLKRTDRPSGVATLKTYPSPSVDAQPVIKYTDTSAPTQLNSVQSVYKYELQTTKSGETATADASVTFLDSNIATTTTATPQSNTGTINVFTYVGNVPVTSGPCTVNILREGGEGELGRCTDRTVSKAPGTYRAVWVGQYPNGADLTSPPIYDPVSVALSAGDIKAIYIYFAAGVNTGTINVRTKVNRNFLTDPSSQNGTCQVDVLPGYPAGPCIRTISNASPGTYSLSNLIGLPVGATQAQIPTLSSPQFLPAGGSIDLVIDFPVADNPYSVGCASYDEKSIRVFWGGNVPTAKAIQLYGSNSQIPANSSGSGSVLPVTIPGNLSYAYIDGGLAQEARRWYVMKTTDNSDNATWSNIVNCTPIIIIPDVPTDLKVNSIDRNTLNVTWKDNVTTNRAHHFEVQRIKATPLTSTDFVGASRSSASVSFSWKNATGYVTYNSVLERSTSSNSSIRFSKSDASMTPLTPPELLYDPYANGNTNGSSIIKSFAYIDSGVGEATVYYYQLKACFPDSVAGLYTPGDIINPKPDKACSGYTSVIATTTLPNAPSNLTATTISPSKITVTWKDNSAKEQGFRVYRNGISVATLSTSAATGATLSFNDSGLNSGTTYTYAVRSFITDPLSGTELVSAASNSASATTWVTLAVTASSSVGGKVTGVGIDCGNGGTSCSNDFEKGYPVTLTATPAASYNFTKWTGGVCNNSTSASCSFIINSDVSVTANFTYVPPVIDLCQNVTGVQTITPCADTLCVAPATWNMLTQTCVRPPLGDNSGDVNGDGLITCADVNLINQFVANGNTGLSATQQKWADVSENGTVSAYDAALLNLSCPGASAAPAGATIAGLSGVVNPAGIRYANIYGVAKDTVAGWWSGVVSAFKSGWNVVAGLFNSIGVNKAEAVTDGVYNNYFGLKKLSADMSSALRDVGLDENSIYIYRVRVVYDGGAGPAMSNWSVKAAGKTLGAGGAVLCPDGVTPPPCPNDGGAPVIYSGLTASGAVNLPFSYGIKANNSPTSYSASGLPNGLNISTSTGAITGTPTVVAVSNVSISALNAKGTDTKTLKIAIFKSGGGGGGGNNIGGMCAGNNLCDKSIPITWVYGATGLLLEQSEIQCVVNADCADVGRYSKTFQEQ